jgi:hypothetical protein
MKRFHSVLLTCLGVAAGASAQIQPVISGDEGEGKVDWSERSIVATGIGAPNPDLPEAAQRPAAIRAATMVAIRNALETVKGMYLNSTTTVENFMTTNDVVQSKVSGFVKGYEQEGRTRYMSDGSVEVTVKIPLDGIDGLGKRIYGDELGESPAITRFTGKKSRQETVFTGLIIDCRGLELKPALSPKVLDQSGKEIYGSAYVSREWAVKHGMVGYAKDIEGAASLDRVGDAPGKVKAVKASGQNSTDVVVSDSDAADIRSAAENLKFLSECRVVFVLD